MNTETNLPDGLKLAMDIIESTMAGPNARSRARSAVKSEHAQRVTLQHHACDLAQRVADLEAERVDLLTKEFDLVAERDTLRARLAEIEGQEPICWAAVDFAGGTSVEYVAAWKEAVNEHINDCINLHEIDAATGWVVRPLFSRPVPAVPAGWRLVPEEPTPEMEEAGKRWGDLPLTTWLDMLDAAPEAAR
jgi:hypothetical protein